MSTRTAAGATTLPQSYFTSDEIFRREMEAIFSRRWLFAGHVSRLAEPGDFFLFEIDRESLILLRDPQGEVRGFFNVCRHRGARLCSTDHGQLSQTIRCPYHAWTYGLDGELLGAPIMSDVAGFDRQDHPLAPVAVRVWEGLIFVNLDPRPRPFDEVFSPLVGKFDAWQIADLEAVHQTVYEVEANWKLLFQNYSECYHCPALHPALNKLTPFRNASNDLEEGPFLGGPMRMEIEGGSMTMTGQRCAPPFRGLSGEDLNLVQYYTVFPNLLLSLHPDYVLIHRLDRLATDRTRIVCDWLFHRETMEAPGFDPSPAVEFWNMTNKQDWQVSELSQAGITSRAYTPGPYAELESMIAAWDREYLRALDESGEVSAS